MNVIICDIDGTVALHGTHRHPYDYTKVLQDEPNEPVITIVRTMLAAGHKIIYMSGREDSAWSDTYDWLRNHGLVSWYEHSEGGSHHAIELHMRKTEDRRPDAVVKKEMYDTHIVGKGRTVLFCLDDRDRIVRLWRDMGLTCLQVCDGDY